MVSGSDQLTTFQKSIPPACGPTSTDATFASVARSKMSTVPGSDPMPSTVTNTNLSSDDTATPLASLRVVGTRPRSLPDAISMIETDPPRLFLAVSPVPSCVTARLYGPSPLGMRRFIVHVSPSISTMSLLLLHATKILVPFAAGCAQVGEQVTSPGFNAAMPCPDTSCDRPAVIAATGPVIPCSLPFPRMKCRETLNVFASLSTVASFIMHAE